MLDESLREAGVNQLYGTSAQTRQRALASVEKEVRKIRERRRVPARDLDRFVEDIMDGLTNQLYNMPLDLFIESRVHADFPALYDAQFAGLARQTAENAQILRDPQMRELIPPRVFGASTAMNAAFALFVDDLFGGRTAYAEAYQPAGALPTGRKLYALFRKMSDDKRPGVEYALVDAWADELRLRDWCLWLPDEGAAPSSVSLEEARTAGHRTAQQTTAMREGGATNLEYLADPMVQMSATMYMLGALQRFSKMELEQVEAVALEIAVIGMQGINYIAGQEQYTLRTLPDEQFSGMQLLCMEYVGFKMTHPELNPAIPLDDAYKSAKGMFDAGMGR